jgi:hypothetical protein
MTTLWRPALLWLCLGTAQAANLRAQHPTVRGAMCDCVCTQQLEFAVSFGRFW